MTLLYVSREILKEFLPNSTLIMNWSIALIGASFLSIVSNSYYKPKSGKMIYLLLFPAWGLLALSIYYGVRLNDAYTSTGFINPKAIDLIEQLIVPGTMMNECYASQIQYFYFGAGIIVIWLIAVVLFWMFEKKDEIDMNPLKNEKT